MEAPSFRRGAGGRRLGLLIRTRGVEERFRRGCARPRRLHLRRLRLASWARRNATRNAMADPKPGNALIAGHRIAFSFGERQIHKALTFKILPGDRIGVVGANGCGKSTFMKVLAGLLPPTDGQLVRQDGLEVGYVEQEPVLEGEKTVRENVELGVAHIKEMIARYEKIGEEMGEPDADIDALCEEQQALQDQIEAKKGWEIDRHIEIAMTALRCPRPDAKAKTLSGGEKRRVAL